MGHALTWLFIVIGLILTRLNDWVGLIWFGTGILALVVYAIGVRLKRTA